MVLDSLADRIFVLKMTLKLGTQLQMLSQISFPYKSELDRVLLNGFRFLQVVGQDLVQTFLGRNRFKGFFHDFSGLKWKLLHPFQLLA